MVPDRQKLMLTVSRPFKGLAHTASDASSYQAAHDTGQLGLRHSLSHPMFCPASCRCAGSFSTASLHASFPKNSLRESLLSSPNEASHSICSKDSATTRPINARGLQTTTPRLLGADGVPSPIPKRFLAASSSVRFLKSLSRLCGELCREPSYTSGSRRCGVVLASPSCVT